MDISLALGGGGSRGYAHIGVLRRLEQEGLTIKAIAGTSAGGIIAAAYAAGHTPDELEDLFSEIDQTRLFARSGREGPGILGLSGATRELEKVFGDITFEELDIPCGVVAVDLICGCEVTLCQGRVVDSILATIAVPGVFPPKDFGGRSLVDGAVLNPVPVTLARELAPRLPVVAVVLEGIVEQSAGRLPAIPMPVPVPAPIVQTLTRTRIAQAFNIFLKSVDLGTRKLAELRLRTDHPEVIIRPDVKGIGLLDAVDVRKVAHAGEKAAEAALPELRQMAGWSRRLRQFVFPRKVSSDT